MEVRPQESRVSLARPENCEQSELVVLASSHRHRETGQLLSPKVLRLGSSSACVEEMG